MLLRSKHDILWIISSKYCTVVQERYLIHLFLCDRLLGCFQLPTFPNNTMNNNIFVHVHRPVWQFLWSRTLVQRIVRSHMLDMTKCHQLAPLQSEQQYSTVLPYYFLTTVLGLLGICRKDTPPDPSSGLRHLLLQLSGALTTENSQPYPSQELLTRKELPQASSSPGGREAPQADLQYSLFLENPTYGGCLQLHVQYCHEHHYISPVVDLF